MKSKLYKLALWYIEKCNGKWDKRKYEDKLKSLDRLTYWNFGKYMLTYGADAEWRIFSRYEVLDNAIQKLAKYENNEKEIRNKAIDEFAERICNACSAKSTGLYSSNGFIADIMTLDGITETVVKIAEHMKGGENK